MRRWMQDAAPAACARPQGCLLRCSSSLAAAGAVAPPTAACALALLGVYMYDTKCTAIQAQGGRVPDNVAQVGRARRLGWGWGGVYAHDNGNCRGCCFGSGSDTSLLLLLLLWLWPTIHKAGCHAGADCVMVWQLRQVQLHPGVPLTVANAAIVVHVLVLAAPHIPYAAAVGICIVPDSMYCRHMYSTRQYGSSCRHMYSPISCLPGCTWGCQKPSGVKKYY